MIRKLGPMKTKRINWTVSLILLVLSKTLTAGNIDSTYYIEFKSGEKLYGNSPSSKLEWYENNKYVYMDGKTYKKNFVHAYYSPNGYFINYHYTLTNIQKFKNLKKQFFTKTS